MKPALAFSLVGLADGLDAIPRNVRIEGQQFVLSTPPTPIVLTRPNIVVKGPPYLPAVAGDAHCGENEVINESCARDGICVSCTTFNQADIDHIKSLGWNFVRLSVVWAGAQPRDEDALDSAFLERLHAVLNLTDANSIHVMLDNHGDMTGSAACGNGAPLWVQQKAAPNLIGKPLKTSFPFNLIPGLSVSKVKGYDVCGNDESKWAAYKDDPNYNLLNECCQAMNARGPGGSDNPGNLGFTTVAQKTMDYMIKPGQGRDEFVRYWKLMADAVKQHPSAFAFELMNEPFSLHRKWYFQTWQAAADAISEVIPDASVSICDIGEGAVFPSWFTKLSGFTEDIPRDVVNWIRSSNNVFYAWHYGDVPQNIINVQAISEKWGVPSFGTEVGCGSTMDAAAAANISASYWHYSSYCNTGPAFGNHTAPDDTFGACILGWGGADSSCGHHISPGQRMIV